MKRSTIAAAVALFASTSPAWASLYDFTYESSAGILAGTFDGTLQGDGNTLVVSSVLDFVTLGGVAGPSLPYVLSTDYYLPSSGSYDPLATVTLDGSWMDLLACTDSDCDDGFTFNAGNAAAAGFEGPFEGPFVGSSSAYGSLVEPFEASRWTISAVPVPATLPLMLLGGAVLGAAARRRRTSNADWNRTNRTHSAD